MKIKLLALIAMLASGTISVAQEKKETIEQLMPKWEKDVKDRMSRDPRLRVLAAKYPLVLLHSEKLYTDGRTLGRSAYSFIHESTDEKVFKEGAQMVFHDYLMPANFRCFGRDVLVVRLEATDFEQKIEPAKIPINHPGILTHVFPIDVAEGETYLQRIRDEKGNNFYVVFQVVALDGQCRYMAFLWRTLPGGNHVGKAKKS
jgi:hypothetical protein